MFHLAQIFVAFVFAKNNIVFAGIARNATNKANYIINYLNKIKLWETTKMDAWDLGWTDGVIATLDAIDKGFLNE